MTIISYFILLPTGHGSVKVYDFSHVLSATAAHHTVYMQHTTLYIYCACMYVVVGE